ncbi:hypothetical protein [Archangium sp.]|uniref:hypothetical protein n=1 Tax=Archangium sp. TaxID=1872627 RepID=UPI002ED86900
MPRFLHEGQGRNAFRGYDVTRLVQGWLGERFEAEPGIAAQVLDHVIGRSVARG